MKLKYAITIGALVFASSNFAGAVEELKLCFGSTSYHSIFKEMIPVFLNKKGIRIVNAANLEAGSVTHIRDMAAGKCEGAIGNLDFEDMIKLMKDNGIEVDKSKLTSRVIGREFLKIITNKNIEVKRLSMGQLRGIFTGATKNWKLVGGPDLDIKVFHAKNKSVTTKGFVRVALEKGIILPSAQELPDFEDVVKAVMKTDGAISFVPSAIPLDGAIVIETDDKIGTPKTLVSIGKPSKNLNILIDYIREMKL